MITPVAFVIFNRPETTRRVFAAIREHRPSHLFVIADGPRASRPGEDVRCAKTRAIVDQGVDWPCTVERHYSDVNLGCKRRLSSGFNWLFEQVEEAIILEDDCLPHSSFFSYCAELLARYRNDEQIGVISGNQFLTRSLPASYRFSAYNHIWGWASWRRAWRHYDVTMADWPARRKTNWLRSIRPIADEALFWSEHFDRVHAGQIDTWDYQWTYACWRQGMHTILPATNLVSNIGFSPEATHTTECQSPLAERPTAALATPLIHPATCEIDREADAESWRLLFRGGLRARLRRRLKLMLSAGPCS